MFPSSLLQEERNKKIKICKFYFVCGNRKDRGSRFCDISNSFWNLIESPILGIISSESFVEFDRNIQNFELFIWESVVALFWVNIISRSSWVTQICNPKIIWVTACNHKTKIIFVLDGLT